MRILSPVDNLAEVQALADAGADEVYGGYVPTAWVKKYSMLGSANQRYFPSAQITDARELGRVINSAHGCGIKFFLTMNAPYYTERQYSDLLDEARSVSGMGADALIVSDLGLLLRLRDALPEVNVHLSTLQTVFNSEAARFFHRLGISRMVLPRELTLAEMAGVVKSNPGVEFDAFVMVGKCPNIEGFCTFTHNSPSLVWPCEERYDIAAETPGESPEGIINAQAGWSGVNRRQACGLCGLPRLQKAGVTALKLVGRGGPTKMKVAVIKAVKDAVDMMDAGVTGAEYATRAKEVYRNTFGGPCNPYVCYFPEVWG